MRRLIALAAAWGVVACASTGAPPGGPEDRTPPELISIKPDSGQVNVKAKEVDFVFDEVVAQQALGATDLSRLFLVSPRDGDPNISWHRQRISVKPRNGFRPNTAYTVIMMPGLGDLRGNARKEGASITFSTGPVIPRLGITGIVFDWATQRIAANAYVMARPQSDTMIAYVSTTDSTGHFEIGPLDSGTYLLRGLIDQNNNHTIDRNEKWDSVTVHVADTRPARELDAIERDSTPPLMLTIAVEDSVTIRVSFDKYIDPLTPLQPALVDVTSADSVHLDVQRVMWGQAFDAAKRAADSASRAPKDTSRARPTAPPTAVAPAPRPPVGVPGARPAPPPPKPKAPPPDKVIVVTLSPTTPVAPLKSYRLTARGFRNLVGHAGEQTRPFQPPKPAPRDSTKRDSTARARPPDTTKPPGKPPV